jgi:CRISPR-associated protein Cas1
MWRRGRRASIGGVGDFVRDDDDDLRNKMLNYGYAVVRAGVARALVASGFLPAFGLKHDGAANAFNLADDLVEPFRPFVDALACKTFRDGTDKNGDLTLEDRRSMAGALLLNGKVGEGKVSLLVAAEMAAASLSRALEFEKPAFLELPELERDS